jgi:hypothetical protein
MVSHIKNIRRHLSLSLVFHAGLFQSLLDAPISDPFSGGLGVVFPVARHHGELPVASRQRWLLPGCFPYWQD